MGAGFVDVFDIGFVMQQSNQRIAIEGIRGEWPRGERFSHVVMYVQRSEGDAAAVALSSSLGHFD